MVVLGKKAMLNPFMTGSVITMETDLTIYINVNIYSQLLHWLVEV